MLLSSKGDLFEGVFELAFGLFRLVALLFELADPTILAILVAIVLLVAVTVKLSRLADGSAAADGTGTRHTGDRERPADEDV